jgi:hypothetical protein
MKRLITLHSENLFFLFLFALLIIGFLCSSVTAENGPSPLVTPGSVSGLGTMAVVNSPVPVDKGGTGKTTAAAALVALGGGSLNGSSTVDFVANKVSVADGTAATPSFSFSADANTGIYSPAADSIGFSAGGAGIATFTTAYSAVSPVDGSLTVMTGAKNIASGTTVALESFFGSNIAIQRGRLTITWYSNGQGTGVVYVNSNGNAVAEIEDVYPGSAISTTAGTPDSINIFADGDGTFSIQNTRLVTSGFLVVYEGAR